MARCLPLPSPPRLVTLGSMLWGGGGGSWWNAEVEGEEMERLPKGWRGREEFNTMAVASRERTDGEKIVKCRGEV